MTFRYSTVAMMCVFLVGCGASNGRGAAPTAPAERVMEVRVPTAAGATGPATARAAGPIEKGDLVVVVIRRPSPPGESGLGLTRWGSRVDETGMIFVGQLKNRVKAEGLLPGALAKQLQAGVERDAMGATVEVQVVGRAAIETAKRPFQWPEATTAAALKERLLYCWLAADDVRFLACFDQSSEFRALGAKMWVMMMKSGKVQDDVNLAIYRRFTEWAKTQGMDAVPGIDDDKMGVRGWSWQSVPEREGAIFSHDVGGGIACDFKLVTRDGRWYLAVDPPAGASAAWIRENSEELRQLIADNVDHVEWRRECADAVGQLQKPEEIEPTFSRLRSERAARKK